MMRGVDGGAICSFYRIAGARGDWTHNRATAAHRGGAMGWMPAAGSALLLMTSLMRRLPGRPFAVPDPASKVVAKGP